MEETVGEHEHDPETVSLLEESMNTDLDQSSSLVLGACATQSSSETTKSDDKSCSSGMYMHDIVLTTDILQGLYLRCIL